MRNKLCFLTKNEYKIREMQTLFKRSGIMLNPIKHSIEELQTEDVDKLLRHKILSAFSYVGRPVFVDHTCLRIKGFADLPGGLTQIFWDRLQDKMFAHFFSNLEPNLVVATTDIAYCDGKQIFTFHGEIEGSIAKKSRGSTDFQWDCVFIPSGYQLTFAELGDKKNEISMRRIAFDSFINFLKEREK